MNLWKNRRRFFKIAGDNAELALALISHYNAAGFITYGASDFGNSKMSKEGRSSRGGRDKQDDLTFVLREVFCNCKKLWEGCYENAQTTFHIGVHLAGR